MSNFVRAAIASAVLAGFGMVIYANGAQAALGQTALGNCYDLVMAACNKKADHAVIPCANSGMDQCDEQYEKIELPAGEIGALRANALRSVRPSAGATR